VNTPDVFPARRRAPSVHRFPFGFRYPLRVATTARTPIAPPATRSSGRCRKSEVAWPYMHFDPYAIPN